MLDKNNFIESKNFDFDSKMFILGCVAYLCLINNEKIERTSDILNQFINVFEWNGESFTTNDIIIATTKMWHRDKVDFLNFLYEGISKLLNENQKILCNQVLYFLDVEILSNKSRQFEKAHWHLFKATND